MAICPGKVLVLRIIDNNSGTNDNFEIILNGNVVGNFTPFGSILLGSSNTNLILPPDGPIDGALAKYYLDDSIIIDGINTIYMRNTYTTGIDGPIVGNQFLSIFGAYDVVGDTLSNYYPIEGGIASSPKGEDTTGAFIFTCPTTSTTCNPCWLVPPDTNIPENPSITLTTQNPTSGINIYTTIAPNINVLSPEKVRLFTQTTTNTTQILTTTLNPFTSTSTNIPSYKLYLDCEPIIWKGGLNF